eukprot:m.126766 g.126766  ORF g.126766 m.126766 type:complete len:121 (-) comp13843_c0_seq3:131-493(-)
MEGMAQQRQMLVVALMTLLTWLARVQAQKLAGVVLNNRPCLCYPPAIAINQSNNQRLLYCLLSLHAVDFQLSRMHSNICSSYELRVNCRLVFSIILLFIHLLFGFFGSKATPIVPPKFGA